MLCLPAQLASTQLERRRQPFSRFTAPAASEKVNNFSMFLPAYIQLTLSIFSTKYTLFQCLIFGLIIKTLKNPNSPKKTENPKIPNSKIHKPKKLPRKKQRSWYEFYCQKNQIWLDKNCYLGSVCFCKQDS